jgi:hypothetical protein
MEITTPSMGMGTFKATGMEISVTVAFPMDSHSDKIAVGVGVGGEVVVIIGAILSYL